MTVQLSESQCCELGFALAERFRKLSTQTEYPTDVVSAETQVRWRLADAQRRDVITGMLPLLPEQVGRHFARLLDQYAAMDRGERPGQSKVGVR